MLNIKTIQTNCGLNFQATKKAQNTNNLSSKIHQTSDSFTTKHKVQKANVAFSGFIPESLLEAFEKKPDAFKKDKTLKKLAERITNAEPAKAKELNQLKESEKISEKDYKQIKDYVAKKLAKSIQNKPLARGVDNKVQTLLELGAIKDMALTLLQTEAIIVHSRNIPVCYETEPTGKTLKENNLASAVIKAALDEDSPNFAKAKAQVLEASRDILASNSAFVADNHIRALALKCIVDYSTSTSDVDVIVETIAKKQLAGTRIIGCNLTGYAEEIPAIILPDPARVFAVKQLPKFLDKIEAGHDQINSVIERLREVLNQNTNNYTIERAVSNLILDLEDK